MECHKNWRVHPTLVCTVMLLGHGGHAARGWVLGKEALYLDNPVRQELYHGTTGLRIPYDVRYIGPRPFQAQLQVPPRGCTSRAP
jgi:hypothetical protein